MQTENKPRFYYPELDGLRFIAFLLVFIHNANPILRGTFLEKFSEYSWFGVDLFFCLSGFLITRLLVTEHEQTGKINIRNFYIRRALRIWPLYFLFTTFAVFFTARFQGWDTETLTRLVGMITFTDNFLSAIWNLNFIAFSIHLWTISFEEQFYVMIPWALRWLLKSSPKTKLSVFCLIFSVGTIIRFLFIHFEVSSTAIYILPFTHFESILFGVFMGLGLFDRVLSKVQNWILFLSGTACLTGIFGLANKEVVSWNLMLIYPLIGIGVSLIFYVTIQSHGMGFAKLLKSKVVVYFGKISYGLYVYHILSLVLATNLYYQTGLAVNPQIAFLLGIVLTITISITSYVILERPFLALKRKFSPIPSRPI